MEHKREREREKEGREGERERERERKREREKHARRGKSEAGGIVIGRWEESLEKPSNLNSVPG